MIAIYDVQGYIAGMQSVVSKKFDTSQYDFENSGWYKKGTVLGEDVYLLTVYFTDPTKICSKGRSAKDFENQGIGNVLWFEKTDGSLVQAPLTMDKADDGVSKYLVLYLSYISRRALPDIIYGPEVQRNFKIRTVRKPSVFLPGINCIFFFSTVLLVSA